MQSIGWDRVGVGPSALKWEGVKSKAIVLLCSYRNSRDRCIVQDLFEQLIYPFTSCYGQPKS